MTKIHNMPGHLIRRLQQISSSVFQDRTSAAGFDLTSVQFAALNVISQKPNLDQATVAGLIAYDRATIGGVIDRLENKGLIKRSPSKTDRRAKLVELTEKGKDVLNQLIPIVSSLQNDILTGLNEEEREQFLYLANKAATAGNSLSRAPLVAPKD